MDVTSDSNGKWLTAAAKGGPWFWSSDGGQFWSTNDYTPRAWAALASASEGSVYFAAESNGYVYITSDSFGNVLPMAQLGQRRWMSLAASITGKCRLRFMWPPAYPWLHQERG